MTKIAEGSFIAMEHFLVAKNPAEMVSAQSNLVSWFEQKLAFEKNECEILKDSIASALKSKWGTAALKRQLSIGESRVKFYDKALSASKEGYTLIPNIECDVFAIRVNRDSPKREVDVRHQWNADVPMLVRPDKLEAGEGEYKSALATVDVDVQVENATGNPKDSVTRYFATAADFREIQFPLIAARPEIMEATRHAMALKIFDEISISPKGSIRMRKGDPMIIGRIKGQKIGYTQKEISFLIAWFVDVRTL